MLDLPPDCGISLIVNIFDLKEYKESALILGEPFEPYPTIESKTPPECPSAILPERREKIESTLDDQTITTRNKGYQHYLV